MVAFRKLKFSFQAVAMRFNAKFGNPGTGILILSLYNDLVSITFEDFFCTENSR